MHHKYLLYLFLLSSLPLCAMDDNENANEMNIHEATLLGKAERVQELLDSGVDVNKKAKKDLYYKHNHFIAKVCKGDSPLHVAIRYKCNNILQLLLYYNASADIKNSRGRTPVFSAHCTTKYVKIFFECGTINPQQWDGYSPFHMAAQWAQPGWEQGSKHLLIVKTFLKYNAPVNIEDDDGVTPLDYLRQIDGIKEFYLPDEKSQKKAKKIKKVRRIRIRKNGKSKKITSNAN